MDGLHVKSPSIRPNIGGAGVTSPQSPLSPGSSSESSGVSFGDTLKDAINKVNDLQQTADIKMQQLATGETTDIADVKIAAEKADIALRLMTSVRNKMIDAYNEIMKMQV